MPLRVVKCASHQRCSLIQNSAARKLFFRKMNRFAALLCFTLVCLSSASTPFPVLSEECNTTDLQAGMVLDEINKHREDGYLLCLYRVFDAHRQHTSKGDIYYLTVDVLETTSSVLSKKSWKDAEIRPFHQTVFGRCKAVIHLSLAWRIVHLYAYNCTLSTVPPRLITSMCPDCPVLDRDLDSYVPRAEEMVLKYNSDSNHTHAFKLKKVEKASMQWMVGASYFAEFTIMETNCPRLEANLAHCEFLPADQAHVGFCTGSVFPRPGPDASGVRATCDIYDPKKTCPPQPKHHDHHGHGHGHGHGPHHHHHHNHDGQNQTHSHEVQQPHHHTHDGENPTPSHAEQQPHHHTHDVENPTPSHGEQHQVEHHEKKHAHVEPVSAPAPKPHDSSSEEHTGLKPIPPPPRWPVGCVQTVHPNDVTDFFPEPIIYDPVPPLLPPGSTSMPKPDVPEDTASPVPIGHWRYPEPQPFPRHPSESVSCPAEPKHKVPHVESILSAHH